jgi:hypothetical protein
MKRTLVAVAVVALASCATGQQRPPADKGRLDKAVAEQKRVNRYFHDVVLPKLRPCWDRVQGKGTIEIHYLYEADANRGWAFKKLNGGKSTLPAGQHEAALDCMRQAVAATSLPMEGGDAGGAYSISWEWPVPLPPDATQQAEAMFRAVGGGGGTGCDGHGAAARCISCGTGTSCMTVCVGYDTCTIPAPSPDPSVVRMCMEQGKCASGGPFGVVSGAAMY